MRPLPLLLLALTLGGCAEVAVVDSGHRAVVMGPGGSLQVLGEGAAEVAPDSVVDDFDLRQQEAGGSFEAITADGVPVRVGHPSVGYAWVAEELVQAEREVGPRGAQPLVRAVVATATCRVLSGYRWDQLDPAHIRQAQAEIAALSAAALRPRHLALTSVDLKGLSPRLPGLAQAVTRTAVWQVRSAAAPSKLELARQRAERLRADASGLAAAQAQLAPTLTAGVLQDKSDRAWQRLLRSPHTEVLRSADPTPTLEVTP